MDGGDTRCARRATKQGPSLDPPHLEFGANAGIPEAWSGRVTHREVAPLPPHV